MLCGRSVQLLSLLSISDDKCTVQRFICLLLERTPSDIYCIRGLYNCNLILGLSQKSGKCVIERCNALLRQKAMCLEVILVEEHSSI